MVETYQTISGSAVAEFKDRGSKFLAYAFPISTKDDFKKKLAELKKEHPKAAHHCFAYRLGIDGNEFRVGDDGEPPGSAGKPILGQIDSKQLTDVSVIVVRYFGGALLGVPGLINAYKTCTALALAESPVIEKPVLAQYELEFDYTRMNEVMRVIKKYDCVINGQEMQLFCKYLVGVPVKTRQDVEKSFLDAGISCKRL
jgi:uncharacterized YigZ family protein